MKKRVLYGGLVVMLMYLVGSGFSQGEVQSEEVEWERFVRDAEQSIVATFVSSLCGSPCAMLDSQVLQLAKTYGNNTIFYKADILEKSFFVRLYKILNVPTVILFEGGKEIKRIEHDFYKGAVYDLIFKYIRLAPPASDSKAALPLPPPMPS